MKRWFLLDGPGVEALASTEGTYLRAYLTQDADPNGVEVVRVLPPCGEPLQASEVPPVDHGEAEPNVKTEPDDAWVAETERIRGLLQGRASVGNDEDHHLYESLLDLVNHAWAHLGVRCANLEREAEAGTAYTSSFGADLAALAERVHGLDQELTSLDQEVLDLRSLVEQRTSAVGPPPLVHDPEASSGSTPWPGPGIQPPHLWPKPSFETTRDLKTTRGLKTKPGSTEELDLLREIRALSIQHLASEPFGRSDLRDALRRYEKEYLS